MGLAILIQQADVLPMLLRNREVMRNRLLRDNAQMEGPLGEGGCVLDMDCCAGMEELT